MTSFYDERGVQRLVGSIVGGAGVSFDYDVADTVNIVAPGVDMNQLSLAGASVLVLWSARIRNPSPNANPHDLHFGGNLGTAVDVTVKAGSDETISGLWLASGGPIVVRGVDDQAGTDATAVYAVVTMAAAIA